MLSLLCASWALFSHSVAHAAIPQARRAPILRLQERPAGALAKLGTSLEQALGALPEKEKYNAVLLSLLSKQSSSETSETSAIELVREMSSKRLSLSGEALKALVDKAVDGGSIEDIFEALCSARDNGACRNFATPQLRLPTKPSDSALATLAAVPSDERGAELGAATAASLGVGGLLLLQVLDLVDWTFGSTVDAPPVPLTLLLLGAVWGVDRYLRQGELFALIGRGFARLYSRDLNRE